MMVDWRVKGCGMVNWIVKGERMGDSGRTVDWRVKVGGWWIRG